MTRRPYSDFYDPDLTHEDMGRPTRQELARDEAESRGAQMRVEPCGDCGRCLVCAVRGLAQ